MAVSVDARRLKLYNDEGTKGVLLGAKCQDCGVHIFGPATFCQACTSSNLEAVEFSQNGVLYSYTVVRVPPAGWPGPVPYVLGQVELVEGPQVLAEVIECPETDLKIGMPVELALLPVKDSDSGSEKVVYKWKPASTPKEGVR